MKEVVKTNDKEAIEAKTAALTEASGKLAERMYSQQSQQQSADGESQQQHSHGESASSNNNNDEYPPQRKRVVWNLYL
mgnify:CR=1 FL=1